MYLSRRKITSQTDVQVATLTVTPDSLTDPPSYDVVFSMYRSSDDALPNDQTQVLVVQKQVSPPGVIILRPDSNTTTTGNQMSFQQTIIWAVPEVSQGVRKSTVADCRSSPESATLRDFGSS